jgi:hypothetical protein
MVDGLANKQAKSSHPGVGRVDISLQLLKKFLLAGWSTNNRAIRCTAGIPADARIRSVTLAHYPDKVSIYFRSAELPATAGPIGIDCVYKEVDVEAASVGACLRAIQAALHAAPQNPRRSRLATWLGVGKATDAATVGLRAGMMMALSAVELALPEAAASVHAAMAAEQRG